jgi:hypothetical protein
VPATAPSAPREQPSSSEPARLAPEVERLLTGVTRRLRLGWTLATLWWAAPAVALGALALVLLGWAMPWTWPEGAALVVAVAAPAAVALAGLALRIDRRRAAHAADRGLATCDAFGAALEPGIDEPFRARIAQRARELAAGRSASDAISLARPTRRVAVAAAAGLLAVGLAVIDSPQDRAREQRAEDRATLDAIAGELEAERRALAERATTDGERAVVDELDALLAELASSDDLQRAELALEQAATDLSAQVPSELLSAKAAASGLQRALEAVPLGGGATAAEQLAQAAEGLQDLTPQEQEALAERLAELAESQQLGDPATARAIAEAAQSLAGGDVTGAASALASASSSASSAVANVRRGVAASAASAAANRAARAARDAGSGSGNGNGNGRGRGAGNGQGQGRGSTQGNGGGGSPSGVVDIQGSGQAPGSVGGAGRPGIGSSDTPASDETPQLGDMTLPPEAAGDVLDVGGTPTGEPGDVIGRGNGATQGGVVRVPVADVIADYRDEALDALDRTAVPPQDRDVVVTYFDLIAGGSAGN